MDYFEPGHIANKNDHEGRYAFRQQPSIVLWNLAALAQAMLPLVERAKLEQELDRFEGLYQAAKLSRMRARLGLQTIESGDAELVSRLEELWQTQRIDHNRFLRQLAEWQGGEVSAQTDLLALVADAKPVLAWLQAYAERIDAEAASAPIRRQQMRSVNPRFILRNYMAEEVIREAHQGDYRPLNDLLPVLRHPGDEHPEHARYAGQRPDWAAAINLTCSS